MERHELKELCNDYLVYLLDDGFYVNVETCFDSIIYIRKPSYEAYEYSDVKDYLIPFLTILQEKFKIEIEIHQVGYPIFEKFPIDEVKSDDMDNMKIRTIEIKLI